MDDNELNKKLEGVPNGIFMLGWSGQGQPFKNIITESIKMVSELDKLTQDDLLKRQLELEANFQNEYLLNPPFELLETDGLPIETQIINIKSQLKHCKNPLQKLNLEREMNRLMRERRNK